MSKIRGAKYVGLCSGARGHIIQQTYTIHNAVVYTHLQHNIITYNYTPKLPNYKTTD